MSNQVLHIKSIAEAHQILGLAKPKHPLVSVFRHSGINMDDAYAGRLFSTDFYMIALKEKQNVSIHYGRESYDFQEGSIVFFSPNQVFGFDSVNFEKCGEEWTIVFHPNFIFGTHLGNSIDKFDFFSYEINEALHLSENEKNVLNSIVETIENEYTQRIDAHTQELICINIETLLKNCNRFFDRQFITRKHKNSDILIRFENYLKEYFSESLIEKGIPTVEQCGKALHMSGHYLSNLLKIETGKSIKEHINALIINRAKNRLHNPRFTINDIAYDLGFKYPNHFSKFFKSRTGVNPSEFRNLN